MKNLIHFKTIILAVGLVLQLVLLSISVHAAPGDVDLSFDPGSGVDGWVNATALQPDGKVIICGGFTMVKGLVRANVARLNADGSGDSSFHYTDGRILRPAAVALQPDGKMLVGNSAAIHRLNSDGSWDSSFTAHMLTDGWTGGRIDAIAVQPDGKVLIAGNFEYGTQYAVIARLHADGSKDTGFNARTFSIPPGGWNPGTGYSVVLQSDGKVLVGGYWFPVGGVATGIMRLHADGSRDTGFNQGTGTNGPVRSVAVQSDGKVLMGGEFTSANGTSPNLVARLNADGSLDHTFNPATGSTGFHPYGVRLVFAQPDGKVLIGGLFTLGGTDQHNIARLTADGGVDDTFNAGAGTITSGVVSARLQPDGKVLIAGGASIVLAANRTRVARLNADGSLDDSFDPGAGAETPVSALVVQPDGKVLTGGLFTFINGTNHYGSARLHADGSPDSTFVPNAFDYDLSFLFVWPEDDYAFVTAVCPQPGGKVLVGGSVTNITFCSGDVCNYVTSAFVVRLDSNGRRDPGFIPWLGPGNSFLDVNVQALAVQPDGKILAAHAGSLASETGILRLNPDGTRDLGFNTSLGFEGPRVYSIVVPGDNKVLIGGSFNAVLGTNRNGIARLHADGTLDESFDPATGGYPLAVQADGKILLAGLKRLNADGSLDTSYDSGTGANGIVRAIAVQPDGTVLIGGDFTTINGVMRPYVARLSGDPRPPASFTAWVASFGLTDAAAAADADPDKDGIANGVEYVLGENPLTSPTPVPGVSASARPSATISVGEMEFKFLRDDASETPDVSLKVESGMNLIKWPNVFIVGANTADSSPSVTVSENGTAPDTIAVGIPMGTTRAMFARLKVTITP